MVDRLVICLFKSIWRARVNEGEIFADNWLKVWTNFYIGGVGERSVVGGEMYRQCTRCVHFKSLEV